MIEGIVGGILTLHSHNPPILHRDLKTLNVLVTSDFMCKVCDFGLSRFETPSNAETLLKCRGTIAYIAPEVYNQLGYFKQSDVYSIAIMMWEILNRLVLGIYERPYQEIKIEFRILSYAILENKRPKIPDSVPKSLNSLIMDCWQVDYAQRPDAKQLMDKLCEVRNEYSLNKSDWDLLCKNQKTKAVPIIVNEQDGNKEKIDGNKEKNRNPT